MAVDVLTEIVIGRPPVSSPPTPRTPRMPRPGTPTSPPLTGKPPAAAAGSRMIFVARFLGRRLAYTYEVVDSSRRAARHAHRPGAVPDGDDLHLAAAGDDSTRMTLRNRGDPAGFPRLTAPLMAAAMRHANRKDLRKLRAILCTGINDS